MSNPLKILSSICNPQALNQRNKDWQEPGGYLYFKVFQGLMVREQLTTQKHGTNTLKEV